MSDTYELWGLREDYHPGYGTNPGEVEYHEDCVATFDTIEQVNKYVKDSTLAGAHKQYFKADIHRNVYRFRKQSLLRNYHDYEIRTLCIETPPPHNPVLMDKVTGRPIN